MCLQDQINKGDEMLKTSLQIAFLLFAVSVFFIAGNTYSRDIFNYSSIGITEIVTEMAFAFFGLFLPGYYFFKNKINPINLMSACLLAAAFIAYGKMSTEINKRNDFALVERLITAGGNLSEIASARKTNPHNIGLRGIEEVFSQYATQQVELDTVLAPLAGIKEIYEKSSHCPQKAFEKNPIQIALCVKNYEAISKQLELLQEKYNRLISDFSQKMNKFEEDFGERYNKEYFTNLLKQLSIGHSKGAILLNQYIEYNERLAKATSLMFSFLAENYTRYSVIGEQFLFENDSLMSEYAALQADFLKLNEKVIDIENKINQFPRAK
jgi:hypothetical protein